MYSISQDNLILSYSSLQTLSSCARKFALRKITPMDDIPRDTSAALSNGKAVGSGFATFLETGDLDLAMLEAWHHYYPPLEDNIRSISLAAKLVQTLGEHCTKRILTNWELAYFDGKPAVELSFGIKLAEGVYYIGFLDAVLRHKVTGELKVLELKTTSMANNLTALYKNSSQGISYGLIIDKISGDIQPSYEVLYLVAQLHRSKAEKFRPTIHELPFQKSMVDRLEWLIGLQLAVNQIEAYKEVNMFPRNGGSCMSFGLTCPFFGVCTLSASPVNPKEAEQKTTEVQFMFDLHELIQDALSLV